MPLSHWGLGLKIFGQIGMLQVVNVNREAAEKLISGLQAFLYPILRCIGIVLLTNWRCTNALVVHFLKRRTIFINERISIQIGALLKN